MKPIVKHGIYVTIAVTLNILIYFILLKFISYYGFLIYSILMYITFAILAYLFCSKYLVMYARTMFEEIIDFKPTLDKPRIFLNSLFIPFLIFMILCFNKDDYSNYNYLNIIYLSLFTFGSYILILSWTKEFEVWFVQEIRKVVKKLGVDYFAINLNAEQLGKLFDRLYKAEFLMIGDDINNFTEFRQKFIDTFLIGKFPLEPIFVLNFKNYQTAYFFDKLKKNSREGFLLKRTGCVKIFKYADSLISPGSLSNKKTKAEMKSLKSLIIPEIDMLFEN